MKGKVIKLAVAGVLLITTVGAYGACFHGWFLPRPLSKPVSLRDGSTWKGGVHGGYFAGGRTHYGGGPRSGK